MIKYVEFAGLRDKGVHEYGKIILENGKLWAEGIGKDNQVYLERLWNRKVRDLRPKKGQEWVGKDNPEIFLKILPYYYCGTYLCASRVETKK